MRDGSVSEALLMTDSPIRIDRLVVIIVFDWLPFYRLWNPDQHTQNKMIIERDAMAHKLWEDGCVSKKTTTEAYEVLEPRYDFAVIRFLSIELIEMNTEVQRASRREFLQ